MLIYQKTFKQFIRDVRENKLTEILSENFFQTTGRKAGYRELSSWQNSLSRVRDLIELAGLEDNMIAVEYGLPYNQKRVDCLLFGKDSSGNDNIVLLELKQWMQVTAMEEEGNYLVETYTGGGMRPESHPSQQVEGYHNFFKKYMPEFGIPGGLIFFSCAYCHNYKRKKNSGLFDLIYQPILEKFPVYSREDAKALADKIQSLLGKGKGKDVLFRFLQSKFPPQPQMLLKIAEIIKNKTVFSLLNEQIVAKNLIWSKVKKMHRNKEKSVIIVHGGPGTGKSMIAVNVLAEAVLKKKKVFYGCKSKTFTKSLKSLAGKKGKDLFTSLYRFLPSKINENELHLLLVDEANQIEKSSDFRYTREKDRTLMPPIDQLIRCAKVAVFFIDDRQNVRPQEIGSSDLIREAAAKAGVPVKEVFLETQYRCMGSNDYLLWLESTLGYTSERRILKKTEKFDFKIFDSPQEIYDILKAKEKKKPNSARMVAGYCWPWSDPLKNGKLVKDVVIGDFAISWEAREGFKLAKGIPKWYDWGYKTEGFRQMGCVYTVRGFDFDYIGVIIGNDLVYDPVTDTLKADIKATCDPTLKRATDLFENYVRNIYWILLTRGLKGCYVYFVNKDTERYFRERMEK